MRLTFALVASSVLIATAARADSTTYHFVGNGDIGVTDNVYSAPNSGDRAGDLFFQIRPGGMLSYAAPRMIHDLNGEIEIIQYAFNSREPSFNFRGGWRAFFIPGPRSEVITSIDAGNGILTALGSRVTADGTAINLEPVGRVTVRTANASEYFSWVATRELRLSQTLYARYGDSDDNADEIFMREATTTSSAEAGFAIGLDRSWKRDSVSIEAGGAAQRLERIAPVDALEGSRLYQSVNPRGRATWRHDINRRLSFGLDAGIVFVFPFGVDPYNPGEQRKSDYFPVAGGQFSVTEQWGRGTLSLRRDVQPSLFTAQNTVNDTATIAAALPLPWLDDSYRRSPKFVGTGAFLVQRTQIIDPLTSELESSVGAASLNATVSYAPKPGFTYSLRYELMVQTGDAQAAITGFFRNTIYFSFAVRYPERLLAQVPKRRAGGSVRADRKDLVPIGVEPVVPELIDSEGGEEGDER